MTAAHAAQARRSGSPHAVAARAARPRSCWSAGSSRSSLGALVFGLVARAAAARRGRSGRRTSPRWPARGRCTTPTRGCSSRSSLDRPARTRATCRRRAYLALGRGGGRARRAAPTGRPTRASRFPDARLVRARARPGHGARPLRGPPGDASGPRRSRRARRRSSRRRGDGLGGRAAAATTARWPYRQGKPMRPDVARAFDRMERGRARRRRRARWSSAAFRSDAEQAVLFARHPDPKWVAPPGSSLHRLGTELDLGPPGAYGWLAAHAGRFHFMQRYAWEAWHYGYTLNAALVRRRAARRRQRRRARCRPSCPPRSRRRSRAPRSAGTSPRRCSPRSSTPRATSTRSRSAARARRGSRSSCPARPPRSGLRRPVRRRARDRRPGAPDARPAAALRRRPARARRLQRRPGRRSPPAAASRRTGRRRGYVARILGLMNGAGRPAARRRSRSGWSGDSVDREHDERRVVLERLGPAARDRLLDRHRRRGRGRGRGLADRAAQPVDPERAAAFDRAAR